MPANPPLISVITPCLNGVRYSGAAIESVLAQEYPAFEHIVVDGGSNDGTLEVLQRYPHLRWTSGPDSGQSDAMNKGFARAKGEVIVYLNADDYFEPHAFRAVAGPLANGANFVVGRVKLIKIDGSSFINDPQVTLPEMLRWWRNDAYCYNSTGYFYRREVQESVGPFNVDDHYTMDFEFLVEAARRYAFTKIPDVLGCFRLIPGTKTFENSGKEHETFRRFEPYLDLLEEHDRELYLRERTANFGAQN